MRASSILGYVVILTVWGCGSGARNGSSSRSLDTTDPKSGGASDPGKKDPPPGSGCDPSFTDQCTAKCMMLPPDADLKVCLASCAPCDPNPGADPIGACYAKCKEGPPSDIDACLKACPAPAPAPDPCADPDTRKLCCPMSCDPTSDPNCMKVCDLFDTYCKCDA